VLPTKSDRRDGDVAAGLARIDALAPALDGYHYFHAARADLLPAGRA
jgi:predicted RNA polymerase sigma factor